MNEVGGAQRLAVTTIVQDAKPCINKQCRAFSSAACCMQLVGIHFLYSKGKYFT